MTSYAGMGRTNTFRVNDTAAVKALLEPAFTVLERDAGAPGAVTIFSDEDGDWQRTLFADDDEEGTDIYLPEWIVDYLHPGETAIVLHIGNEGKRHLGAFSIAVHSDGRQIHLNNLDEIYQRAEAEFGVTGINIASY